MPAFSLHPLLPSLQVRVTALYQHGDRLFVGLATGSIQVYSYGVPTDIQEEETRGLPAVKLLKTHSFSRKPIEQIGVLSESKQLVILSDSTITLHALPDLSKAGITTLSQARYAHVFATTTFTPVKAEGSRDLLVVGCRKKVVVYGAGKAGLKDAWELALPHSPRHIIFPNEPSTSTSSPLPGSIHLLYSPTSTVVLHIDPSARPPLSVSELPTAAAPPPPTVEVAKLEASTSSASQTQNATSGLTTGVGGALSGLGGYVGLGGKAVVPVGTRTIGGEVLLARDDIGVFYSSDGNYTRERSLQWPSPPEALAYSNPFIYSVLPVTSPSSNSAAPATGAIQIHLAPTLALRQTVTLPSASTGSNAISSLTLTSRSHRSPAEALAPTTTALFASMSTDKSLSQAEGSSLWAIRATDMGEQIDELVKDGHVPDAIGLVEAVGENGLSPDRRLPRLKTLNAVAQFAQAQYQSAMDTFLIFNVNPALVISLFPSGTISGPLHVPRDEWMELFGAVPGARLEPLVTPVKSVAEEAKAILRLPHLGLSKKGSMDTLRQSAAHTDDGASIASDGEKGPPAMTGEGEMAPRAALEALMYYLSDRRQKLTGAISALSSPLPAETSLPPLHSLPAYALHALPSIPMSEYEPEQLLRIAQVIYTALLKVYLVARPVLVGSLCRIENWCDVQEVEGLLKAQKKFGDLIDLYQGKKMHDKALSMLEELAKEEEDPLDRYPPSIRYLQKLGPGHLDLILESSKWIFAENPKMALQIFTADEPEVEALPRKEVMNFLAQTDPAACEGFLEHVIQTLKEDGADYHDKLAELYLDRARNGDTEGKRLLLDFLNDSEHYRAHRILGRLKVEELPEARAILLGRMGKHEEALRLYVDRLQDYQAAETYCTKAYTNTSDPSPGIYLTLLNIYLRPSPSAQLLLEPALSLITKFPTRLDASAVLDLLPPLVTMQDVRSFFVKSLRDGRAKRNQHRIVKAITGARKDEVDRVLMGLQVKRVRVTDQRICPQCQKRLGQSAIAVHAPRGEVTHLHCKDLFGAKLAKTRG